MLRLYVLLFGMFLILGCKNTQKKQTVPPEKSTIPKPIFTDPNYEGSCDPEIVFNTADSTYYIYYTARRSGKQNTFLQTPIGVAKSKNLIKWEFAGYCAFDGQDNTKDASATYWAPAIISDGESLHMFATVKPDTLTTRGPWGGRGTIVHYHTPLKKPVTGWKKVGAMHADSLSTLDASVYKTDDTYHLWYMAKSASAKKQPYRLIHHTTEDFAEWQTIEQETGEVYNQELTGISYEEAPYIFQWQGNYWLLTDPHKGFAVYKSPNATDWKHTGYILKEPGTGKMDGARARHGSVLIKDGRAFLVYHVEYNREYDSGKRIFDQPLKNRKSALQLVELHQKDGLLVADRNRTITIDQSP